MVAPVKPRKVPMNGKQSFWLVPAIAIQSAPTILEINAVTGINLSCTLLKTFTGLRPTFNKATLDPVLCETDSYQGLDNTGWEMSDLAGAFDPQAAEASTDKLGFEFLREPFTGFAVFRNGVVSNSATPEATTGQFFNIAPVDITAAADVSDPSQATAIASWLAGVAVTGAPSMNVAATAT